MPGLVKPRSIHSKGGRKPKGGARVSYRFSQATLDAIEALRVRWNLRDSTAAIERAVQEKAKEGGEDE